MNELRLLGEPLGGLNVGYVVVSGQAASRPKHLIAAVTECAVAFVHAASVRRQRASGR